MPEPTERPFTRIFALALVVCLAAIGAHSVASHRSRAQLEHWSQTTAIGDDRLYPVETSPPLAFQGKPLTPISPRQHEIRETRVVYAGDDDSKQYRLYKHREDDREGDPEHLYLVKTAPNHFLKLQPAEKK
jgi:hypothetical protein